MTENICEWCGKEYDYIDKGIMKGYLYLPHFNCRYAAAKARASLVKEIKLRLMMRIDKKERKHYDKGMLRASDVEELVIDWDGE